MSAATEKVWKTFQPPWSGRLLLGAARDHRLPVHRLHVDLEAALLEQRLGHRRGVGQHRQRGRLHQHDRRAVIARFLQQRLGLLEVGLDQQAVRRIDGVGRAADEGGGADLVVFGLADRRLEVVLLAHRIERGQADLGVVERLGSRWLKRMMNWWPSGFQSTSCTPLSFLRIGIRSCGGCSIRSISPAIRAFTCCCGSGISMISTRSTLTTLPPARPEAGSARGLYLGFLR